MDKFVDISSFSCLISGFSQLEWNNNKQAAIFKIATATALEYRAAAAKNVNMPFDLQKQTLIKEKIRTFFVAKLVALPPWPL